jgi:hypothetical protein
VLTISSSSLLCWALALQAPPTIGPSCCWCQNMHQFPCVSLSEAPCSSCFTFSRTPLSTLGLSSWRRNLQRLPNL